MDAAQIPVAFSFGSEFCWEHFFVGSNQQLLLRLHQLLQPGYADPLYLWGSSLSGKTHLLSALINQACQQGIEAELVDARCLPEKLLGAGGLIAIDNLDLLIGNAEAQEHCFHFYNRAQQQVKLVFAAQASPHAIAIELADLSSRLRAAETYRVIGLTDAEKPQALQLRAAKRGWVLSDEAALYLLHHGQRSFKELLALLDALDHASLAAKRRPTIPFIKAQFGW